jgi:DNA polymerase-3 subunit delta
MAISRGQLRNQIKKREFLHVYVLYGAETFLRDNAAKTIADFAFTEGDFRDFNDDQFSLNIPENITTALAAANQLPMMAARRVIRITDVRVSTSSMKDTLKEDAEGVLSSYLANPSPSSIVIFVADELNGSRKLGKLLKSHPGAVEFTVPDEAETRRWAQDVFDKAGVSVDAPALRRLVDLVSCDLRRATTQAQKLCTASLPEKHVNVELVDSLVRDTSELTFSSFAEHLVAGRKAEAIAALENVLDNGEEPVALIGTLAWKFRDELKRLNPGVRSDYAERLAFALQRIAATDLAIKTSIGGGGPLGSRRQIEMLVCELASQ